ncbi:MAG: hypothetical protein FWD05_06905 [Oscillospiraceae bacterium]|nr:hypothetical protein [Oscillospiraceae bacterium]
MALGDFKLFQYKSKNQRDREEHEYAVWAFPYGDTQKEKLCELFKELIRKPYIPMCLTVYLTCKELFEWTLKNSESHEEAINKMINVVKGYEQLLTPAETPLYLALVLASAEIDENCEYPSADEIRTRIKELEDMRIVKRSKLFKRK